MELRYDSACSLGHPYLQSCWKKLERNRGTFYIRFGIEVVILLLLFGFGLSTLFHFVIPIICVVYAGIRTRRWLNKFAEFKAHEKQLLAASQALLTESFADVKYVVEDLVFGLDSISRSSSNSYLPNARIMTEGKNSVPAYCGSWPVKNWLLLNESDRCTISASPTPSTYSRGRVYHDLRNSYVLLTDTGIVLWLL